MGFWFLVLILVKTLQANHCGHGRMGLCPSAPKTEEDIGNRHIAQVGRFARTHNDCNLKNNVVAVQALKGFQAADAQIVKLLLLGAGECGKSTILKQMKILHEVRTNAFNRVSLLMHPTSLTVETRCRGTRSRN